MPQRAPDRQWWRSARSASTMLRRSTRAYPSRLVASEKARAPPGAPGAAQLAQLPEGAAAAAGASPVGVPLLWVDPLEVFAVMTFVGELALARVLRRARCSASQRRLPRHALQTLRQKADDSRPGDHRGFAAAAGRPELQAGLWARPTPALLDGAHNVRPPVALRAELDQRRAPIRGVPFPGCGGWSATSPTSRPPELLGALLAPGERLGCAGARPSQLESRLPAGRLSRAADQLSAAARSS